MHINTLRVGLALLWGSVGLGLLTRGLWAGGRLDVWGRDLTLYGVVALALAGWNLFRVAASRLTAPRMNLADAIANHRDRDCLIITDPEFDFTKPPHGRA